MVAVRDGCQLCTLARKCQGKGNVETQLLEPKRASGASDRRGRATASREVAGERQERIEGGMVGRWVAGEEKAKKRQKKRIPN